MLAAGTIARANVNVALVKYWGKRDPELNLPATGSISLTLEGLSVSYFLRASRMYDSLMQMGRWFGYRPGYLDLCRLFTTSQLVKWYRHIALAETELHEFIADRAPRVAYYSEDRGLVAAPDATDVLVVDPIDGTRPAMAGLESACVAVALAPLRDGDPTMDDVEIGCVVEIKTGDWYLAVRGRGVESTRPVSLSPNTENGLAISLPLPFPMPSPPQPSDQPQSTKTMPTTAIATYDIIIMLRTDLARVMPP